MTIYDVKRYNEKAIDLVKEMECFVSDLEAEIPKGNIDSYYLSYENRTLNETYEYISELQLSINRLIAVLLNYIK